ncbi:MAG: protein kinase [Blastocatellia bacterium]|nr:protein kinase [Blastocatellia bacterium]
MSVAIGSRFDRYEIIAQLGAGGMGEVYLARDSRLERKIAIKLLPAEFLRDPARLLRFETEAKAVSTLNHPNIITIHEIGEADARLFITTEFVDGQTVRQLLSRGRIAAQLTLEIAVQIASALAAAHQAGIVHRDIKPENVMLRPDGIVKVLDFGLAKLTERQPSDSDPEAPTAPLLLDTDPGTVMGTATYMSPEQARGLRVDARSDIFSLGVLLYEMLVGLPPFEGATAADIMSQVLNHEPPPVSSRAPGIPVELQRIVTKALRKDREERYQTTKDLLLDLKSLKREMEATTTVPLPGPPRTTSGALPAISYETAFIPGAPTATVPTTGPIAAQSTSSAEYIVTQVRHNRRGALLAAGLLILLATGYFLWNRNHAIDSIAVLPFTTQSAEGDAKLLTDAITDSLINNLSKLPNLQVKSRFAVDRFRNGQVDISAIADELDVHAVLTGSVVQRGDTLSINIALVDADKSNNIWGEQYNRKISDLVLIQQEISRDVSEKLRLKITGEEKKRLDAFQLYLKGRNAWNKRTAEGIQEGIGYFEQATRIDPSYAPPYAGLADSYNMMVNYSFLQGKEAFPKAKEAAEKALSLDESLAEAHAALAYTNFQWEWNWVAAERGFKRAIELKANYSHAHQWYSSLLACTGRTTQSLEEGKRSQEADPFSLIVNVHFGWINLLARKYDQTIRETQQALKLDPNFFAAHRYLGLAYEAQGRHAEAVAALQKAAPLSRGSVLLKAELAHAYAVAGRRDEALQLLREMEQLGAQRHISPYHFALVHLGLGERDRAIDLLNKAFDERAERLVWLRVDPRFDPLRQAPRFTDLIERIGLVQ